MRRTSAVATLTSTLVLGSIATFALSETPNRVGQESAEPATTQPMTVRPQSQLAIPVRAELILKTGFESGDKALIFNPKDSTITALINCRG